MSRDAFKQQLGGREKRTASLRELDQTIYGAIKNADASVVRIRKISIDQIWADVKQPRRAVPSAVRGDWDGSPATVGQMFNQWLMMARLDASYIKALVLRESLPAESNDPLVVKLVGSNDKAGIVQLAASIYEGGVQNPVTVAPRGDGIYVLETGERRWLACHLLKYLFGDDSKATMIPAREKEEASVWVQAEENTQRMDLNAIQLSRQFAILLMDLLSEPFLDASEFDSDIEFYAQVADGDKFRIPRGASERLLSALGLKNPAQLRYLRKALRLPSDVWNMADDEDWPLTTVRDYSKNDAADTSYTVSNDTVSGGGNPFADNPTGAEKPVNTGQSGDYTSPFGDVKQFGPRIPSQIPAEKPAIDEDQNELIAAIAQRYVSVANPIMKLLQVQNIEILLQADSKQQQEIATLLEKAWLHIEELARQLGLIVEEEG